MSFWEFPQVMNNGTQVEEDFEAKFYDKKPLINGKVSQFDWEFSDLISNELMQYKVYLNYCPDDHCVTRFDFEIELENIKGSLNYKILVLNDELPKNVHINYTVTSRHIVTSSGQVYSDIVMFKNSITRTNYGFINGTIRFKIFDTRKEPIRSLSTETTSKYYEELFKNGNLSDIIFVAQDGKEIPAHKCIVSRNEVFAKMIECDMQEKKSGRVEVPDIESAVLKFILRYLYCGQTHYEDHDDLLKILIAADKYSMLHLIESCEILLLENLRVSNAIDVLITADLLNLKSTKINCLEFIKKKKSDVVNTEKFESMAKLHPHLAAEIALLKDLN